MARRGLATEDICPRDCSKTVRKEPVAAGRPAAMQIGPTWEGKDSEGGEPSGPWGASQRWMQEVQPPWKCSTELQGAAARLSGNNFSPNLRGTFWRLPNICQNTSTPFGEGHFHSSHYSFFLGRTQERDSWSQASSSDPSCLMAHWTNSTVSLQALRANMMVQKPVSKSSDPCGESIFPVGGCLYLPCWRLPQVSIHS